MAYTINYSGGTVTLPVGGSNAIAGLTLMGQNFPSYGQNLNQNWVNIIQSSAGSTAPANAIAGQLWFDTTIEKLNYNTVNYNDGPPNWELIISNNSSPTFGNVSAGNISVTGDISSTGNISGYDITSTDGYLVLNNFTIDATSGAGFPVQFSGDDIQITGNANVSGTLGINGNITGGNISTTGIINTGSLVSNGNISGTDITSTTGYLVLNNFYTIDARAGAGSPVQISGANTQFTGNVTVNGNITVGADLFVSGSQVEPLVLANAQTASGNAVSFTGIPSWVKRITVLFQGVSTSGTSSQIIQIGTGAVPTYTTTDYLGSVTTSAGTPANNFSTGFMINNSVTAATVVHGQVSIINISGNAWMESGILGLSNSANTRMSAGSVSLANSLTALRITTVNGTDTFDAGTINIMYE